MSPTLVTVSNVDSDRFRIDCRCPVWLGSKVMLTKQDEPGARGVPLMHENPAALKLFGASRVPIDTLPRTMVVEVLFVKVTCPHDFGPAATGWAPQLRW